MQVPIFDAVPIHGVMSRLEESTLGWNPLLYLTAPYEEMRVKKP
jgi:hypothetical protein